MTNSKNRTLRLLTVAGLITAISFLGWHVNSVMKENDVYLLTQPNITIPDVELPKIEKVEVEPAAVLQTHDVPVASTQSTSQGKSIVDLSISENELYAGYGDYSANTGPMHITSMNINTYEWSDHLTAPNEQLSVWKEINGKLYTPYTDPRLNWTSKVGYSTNASGVWENVETTPFIHVYDVATSDGNDIWLSGSVSDEQGNPAGAAVKRSVDGGNTWTTELTARSDDDQQLAQEFDRFYWLGSAGGKIYAKAQIVSTSGADALKVWSNGTWGDVTVTSSIFTNTTASRVQTFHDKIYMCAAAGITTLNPENDSFSDNLNVTGCADFYATPEALYVLTYNNQLYVTYNGDDWIEIPVTLPVGSLLSVAVNGSQVFFGGGDAKIYRSDISAFNNTIASKSQ